MEKPKRINTKMKTKLTFALVASLTSTAFAEFKAPLPEFKNEKQLAEWRAEQASEATSQGCAAEETAFYTGKPYLASSDSYAFKYRIYNPKMARWTSEDPSGFPDGANGNSYAPTPTNGFDFMGMFKIKLMVGNYDHAVQQQGDHKMGATAHISATGEVDTTYDSIQVIGYGAGWSNINGMLSTNTNGQDQQLGYQFTVENGKLSYTKLGGIGENADGDLHLGVNLHIRWDDSDHKIANIQVITKAAWQGAQLNSAGLTVGEVGSTMSWTAAALPVFTVQTYEIRLKIVE